jgi:hypothetical protein
MNLKSLVDGLRYFIHVLGSKKELERDQEQIEGEE